MYKSNFRLSQPEADRMYQVIESWPEGEKFSTANIAVKAQHEHDLDSPGRALWGIFWTKNVRPDGCILRHFNEGGWWMWEKPTA